MGDVTSSAVHARLRVLGVKRIPVDMDMFVQALDHCASQRGQGAKIRPWMKEAFMGQRFESLWHLLNLLEVGQETFDAIMSEITQDPKNQWLAQKYRYTPRAFDSSRSDLLKKYFPDI